MIFSPVFISLGPSYNQSAHQTPGSWAFFLAGHRRRWWPQTLCVLNPDFFIINRHTRSETAVGIDAPHSIPVMYISGWCVGQHLDIVSAPWALLKLKISPLFRFVVLMTRAKTNWAVFSTNTISH
jgi:hypothetical protein